MTVVGTVGDTGLMSQAPYEGPGGVMAMTTFVGIASVSAMGEAGVTFG